MDRQRQIENAVALVDSSRSLQASSTQSGDGAALAELRVAVTVLIGILAEVPSGRPGDENTRPDEEHAPPGVCPGCPLPLAPGDVVRLRSGGPAMTVLEEDEGELRCGWYDPTADVRMDSGTFPPAALRRVEDEQRRDHKALYSRAAGAIADARALWEGRQDIDRPATIISVEETFAALCAAATEDA